MKVLCGVALLASLAQAAFAASPVAADDDARFAVFDLTNPNRTTRILVGPDENDAVRAAVEQLRTAIRAKTGVTLEYAHESSALGGEVFVSTQPWAAKGAWFVRLKNSILAIHGSDFDGTIKAVNAFREKYVDAARQGAFLGGWTQIVLQGGKQREEVFDAELRRITEKQRGNRDWENECVTERNREPARAYAFPLARLADAFTEELPATPFVKSLNGRWKYHWCGSPKQRPTNFFAADYDDSNWYSIDVPSCVELKGFGRTGYVNILYPHVNNPPYIGDDYNPVSSYRTTFALPSDWQGRRIHLRFDGVYSAYYVWVNGQKVGYAEDSCLPSEFDITPYVKPSGENLLAVEVYRWSDGSYLEDQDMFRLSGIFRDVSVWAEPKAAIRDFQVRTDLAGDFASAVVRTSVKADMPTIVTLYDADYRKVGEGAAINVAAPHLWSAEDPYLYTLVVSGGEDMRTCKVGIRTIELAKNGAVLLNGKSIKFRGVNRHDWSYVNGHTLTRDEMLKDVTLMKRYNIDAVRTAHYPNHPYFYHLCDRYGIYLQADANLEAHGRFYGLDCLAHVPSWTKSHVERCTRMVENYKNAPSVVMWSLGNEAGSGPAFEYAYAAMLKIDDTRLFMNRNDNENFRIQGHGYMNFKEMARIVKWTPYVMSEYAVGKGNAVGNFREYWDVFRRLDAMPGGFIWDWYDQCVKVDTDRLDPSGKRISYWAYGGDFDEIPNDGNYATNGIIGPEREPSPELIEVAHVQQELEVVADKSASDRATLVNRAAFTYADTYEGTWEIVEDGRKIAGGALTVPHLAPQSSCAIRLPMDGFVRKAGCEYFYNVTFRLKKDTPWAPKGWVMAYDQLPLGRTDAPAQHAASASPVSVEEGGETIAVRFGDSSAAFSKQTGTLAALTMNGRTILADEQGICRGPRLTCRRAFTDNDQYLRGPFYASGLTQLRYHPRPCKIARQNDGSVAVHCTVEVDGAKSGGFTHETTWCFAGDGTLRLHNVTTPKGNLPQLPRLGLSMMLDTALENVRYYGRGPWENYIDRCTGSQIGLWSSTVTRQFVDYVRPQDNGYKTAVRWAAFLDDGGTGVLIKGSEPMCLQALHFGVEELEFSRQRGKGGWKKSVDAEHVFAPLIPRKEICLNVDLRQLGLGNAACGPRPLSGYTFPNQREEWDVTFVPVRGGRDAANLRDAARRVPQTVPVEPHRRPMRETGMGFDGA